MATPTQIDSYHAQVIRGLVESLDGIPAQLRACGLTAKEAALLQTRINALNAVFQRHVKDAPHG